MRKAFESHKGTCRRQFVAFCSTVRFQRLPNNVLLALGIDERIEDILLLVVARLKVAIDDEGESLLRLKLEITKFIIIRGKRESQGLFRDKKLFRTKSFSRYYEIYAGRFIKPFLYQF